MTKKRLTLEKNEIIEYIEIVEDGVVLFFEDGHSQKFNGEEFVEMINNLSFELKECREIKLFSRRQLEQENEQLKRENKHLRCTIESNSQDDYIDYLEKQNERLKERIEELASNDKIVFMNG